MSFDHLRKLLEHLAARPGMFLGPVTFVGMRTLLFGLRAGLNVAGFDYTWEEYEAAARARGWNPADSIGIERDLRRHELTEDEMVRELVAVETAAYVRAMARFEEPAGTKPADAEPGQEAQR